MEQIVNHRLGSSAGFFSELFFVLNSFIYAKLHKYAFQLDTSRWSYKIKNGWSDYFEPLPPAEGRVVKVGQHCREHDKYTLQQYRDAINELWRPNDDVSSYIKEKVKELDLPDTFSALYIRRGDKMISESLYIPTSTYVTALLKQQPDDYTVYEEVVDEVKTLPIRVVTLCPKTRLEDRRMPNISSLIGSANSDHIRKKRLKDTPMN